MIKVINRKKYNTATAVIIATNDFADGQNQFNCGRSSSLYRTQKGEFFSIHETCYQGEHDSLQPRSEADAIDIYEAMTTQEIKFEDAFPGVEVEDA